MPDVALAAFLLFILLQTLFAGTGREGTGGMTRWMTLLCGLGVLMAVALPHWSQSLVLLCLIFNVQRQHPPSTHINYLETCLVVTGGYLLLIQHSWAWAVPYFLWALTAIGTYMGLWALISVYYFQCLKYEFTFGWGPFRFTFEERGQLDDAGKPRPGAKAGDIWCGQFMTNFTQAIFCLTIAATVGLLVTGGPWGLWLTLPIQAFTLLHYLKIHGGIGQWVVHLGVLGCAVLWLTHPWLAVNLAVTSGACFLLFLLKRQRLGQSGGADSGRLLEWQEMLRIWFHSRNRWSYLFGFGIRSWVQVAYDKALMKAKTTGQYLHNIFTMAHNEYIQSLFESGVVGTLALVVCTGWMWQHAFHVHIGLWLVGTVMLSIAQLSYPWAFYHRAVVPALSGSGKSTFHEHRFGSPGLFWISFLLAVLAHG